MLHPRSRRSSWGESKKAIKLTIVVGNWHPLKCRWKTPSEVLLEGTLWSKNCIWHRSRFAIVSRSNSIHTSYTQDKYHYICLTLTSFAHFKQGSAHPKQAIAHLQQTLAHRDQSLLTSRQDIAHPPALAHRALAHLAHRALAHLSRLLLIICRADSCSSYAAHLDSCSPSQRCCSTVNGSCSLHTGYCSLLSRYHTLRDFLYGRIIGDL
jgi:hypothetical protein